MFSIDLIASQKAPSYTYLFLQWCNTDPWRQQERYVASIEMSMFPLTSEGFCTYYRYIDLGIASLPSIWIGSITSMRCNLRWRRVYKNMYKHYQKPISISSTPNRSVSTSNKATPTNETWSWHTTKHANPKIYLRHLESTSSSRQLLHRTQFFDSHIGFGWLIPQQALSQWLSHQHPRLVRFVDTRRPCI